MGSYVKETQTAWIGSNEGTSILVNDAPIPKIAGERCLIKTKAISVNPVDTKLVGDYVTKGAVAGFDFAGVVEEVGPDAKNCNIKVGDRVCSAVVGMNPADPTIGAWAEYTAAVEWILLKIPDEMSFEEGATLGISFLTAGMGLFYSLGLPGNPEEPVEKPTTVFVFGGSSATGTASIQLLKAAGHYVITTCSPHNFDLAKSYGADEVYDYRAEDAIEQIKVSTKNGLRYILDCISTTDSNKFCYQVMGRPGGKFCALEPFSTAVAATRKVVKPDWIMGPSLLGQEVGWPEPHYRAADPVVAKFGAWWTAILNKMLAKGQIKLHPIVERSGGLEKIPEGLDDIRSGKVSGKKLVYPLSF